MSRFLCTHKPDPEFPKLNCNEWSKPRWVDRGQHRGSVGRKSTCAFSLISGGHWDGQRGSGAGGEEGWGMCVIGVTKPHLCPHAQRWGPCHRGQGAATARCSQPQPLPSRIPIRTAADAAARSVGKHKRVQQTFFPAGNGKKVNGFSVLQSCFLVFLQVFEFSVFHPSWTGEPGHATSCCYSFHLLYSRETELHSSFFALILYTSSTSKRISHLFWWKDQLGREILNISGSCTSGLLSIVHHFPATGGVQLKEISKG